MRSCARFLGTAMKTPEMWRLNLRSFAAVGKRVEMLFANLKRILKVRRLRLRGAKRREGQIPACSNRTEFAVARQVEVS
jgi:hypothetical protein